MSKQKRLFQNGSMTWATTVFCFSIFRIQKRERHLKRVVVLVVIFFNRSSFYSVPNDLLACLLSFVHSFLWWTASFKRKRKHLKHRKREKNDFTYFFKNAPTPASFSFILGKFMWKNVYPVYGAYINTHNLRNMSLLP